MKNLNIALRSLFKKGRSNGIKILSLGVGLAMGLVLIAKVCFELSYDDFYPDSECIYQIRENMEAGEKKMDDMDFVSGGVAPGMKLEIPGVVAATRCTFWVGNSVFFMSDKNKYKADFLLADECFFDVLPRKVLTGDAKQILSRPLYVLVSESLAERIGEGKDVTGMSFELASFPGRVITIGGVFEDVPENSHLRYDVLLSLCSIKDLMGWTHENGWFGGDSYHGYIKVQPEADQEALEAEMAKMLDRHVPPEKLKEMGMTYRLSLKPLKEVYATSSAVKGMAVMLSLIAFSILFAALMNYILLMVSSLVVRSKEVAIHKCYGASGKNISGMIFSETFVNLFASVLLSALLILALREMVEELLKASLGALFTWQTILLLAGVCLLVFLFAGLFPSYLFSRVPVAVAFRSYTESRRLWKKGLLFIQFVAVGFLVTLLAIIGLQYQKMVTDNPGYSYDRVVYTSLFGVESSAIRMVMDELGKLPEVEAVAVSSSLPVRGGDGGNMIYRNGSDDVVLHINDLGRMDADYISLMDIKVIEGKAFDRSYSDSARIVMVSRMTAEKLALTLGWKDGVVGKKLYISGHGKPNDFEIIGVYDEVRVGAIRSEIMPPTVWFYSSRPGSIVSMKLHGDITVENMKLIEKTIQKLLPDKDISVNSYEVSIINMYSASRLFRNSVMLGGLVTFLITLVGLIGYIADETTRRRKEIAIRKVNGATVVNIMAIISKDILYMAIPAVLLGVMSSYWMGENWLQQFSEKIPLSVFIFAGSALAIWLVVLVMVVARTWSIANEDPVKSLKSE
ncbi:FtsX-like permease family protein [Parabacteroides sp. AF17-28]|uniref:FtsX-like permease family protein n=1 Tax=Parabacteroides sp. AF17-28 TaxID=2292241 RepID=UPI000EFDD3E6|nr:FtsX-like permease family protein [Parabacteroides sp. AF17-28]RHR61679.1 hypothetical protein DWW90_02535 [Parabacteroides sp. AF17-28]